MTARGHRLAFTLICGVAALAAWQGPALVAHWRADRTARQVAEALYRTDSTRLLGLSAMGSAGNLL